MVHTKETNGFHAAAPAKLNDNNDSSNNNNALHITDKRTGREYDIPIRHNSVQAVHFKNIRTADGKGVASPADNVEGGLRIVDPGFQNTAVKESNITFV